MALVPALLLLCSLLAAYLLTALVRAYALRRELLDIPNARSSHSLPTPRGGGLSLVLVLVACGAAVAIASAEQRLVVVWLVAATAAYALLGWLDDHHDLSATSRLLVQLLLATAALLSLPLLQLLPVAGIPMGWLGIGGGILWVVWMANLYNFMDGIDGIAGVQTLVLAMTLAIWFAQAGGDALALLCLALAGASLGFLAWNWSPARIFMGDVGSVALGACFALLGLLAAWSYGIHPVAILVLYAVFLADATLTLLRRLLQGEKWWQAHRTHYYQRAVQSGWSHARVSLAVFLLDLVLAAAASLVVWRVIPAVAAALFAASLLLGVIILLHLRGKRTNGAA